MKIWKLGIRNTTSDYGTFGLRYLLPTIEYRHKYWYLWEINFLFLHWHFNFEICHEDWNKYEENK